MYIFIYDIFFFYNYLPQEAAEISRLHANENKYRRFCDLVLLSFYVNIFLALLFSFSSCLLISYVDTYEKSLSISHPQDSLVTLVIIDFRAIQLSYTVLSTILLTKNGIEIFLKKEKPPLGQLFADL